jgi:hypothetical protein
VLAIALVSVFVFGGGPPGSTSGRSSFGRPAKLQALIRDVIWNELQAREHPRYNYEDRLTEETPDSSRTSLQIQTQQGLVTRLIGVNGKAPSEKQCRGSLDLLNRIAADPALQESRLRSQRSETRRLEMLFAEMPAAFLFQYEGTERTTGWLRIRYWPNPAFHSSNRVAGVLLGLQGTMWIDPSSKRIARIQGSLNKAVTFGWGIIARLQRGGNFVLEQSRLPDGTWHEKLLFVNFTGSILVFKRLNVNLKQTLSAYKQVTGNLTLAHAVDMLRRVPVHCTQP